MSNDIQNIRVRKVRQLIDDRYGGVLSRFASGIGKAPAQVRCWLTPDKSGSRNIGEKVARHIEEAMGLPRGWLENEQLEDVIGQAGNAALGLVRVATPVSKAHVPSIKTGLSGGEGCRESDPLESLLAELAVQGVSRYQVFTVLSNLLQVVSAAKADKQPG